MNDIALSDQKAAARPAKAPAGASMRVSKPPPEPATATGTVAGVVDKASQDDRTGRYLMSGTAIAIVLSYLISRRGYYTAGDDVVACQQVLNQTRVFR